MAWHARTDHARNRRIPQQRHGHGIPGHRPHCRQPAYRPPVRHHDAASPAAVRPQTHHPGGWCHRNDWRPFGEEPGAQPPRCRNALPQPGMYQATSGQIPRLRCRRPQQGRVGEQLRLDERLHLPRLRPHSGQAYHRQLHDGQGECAAAPQRHCPRRCNSAATTNGAT